MTLDLFFETDVEKLVDYIKDTHNPNKPLLFWVDLFCGCGGVTEGYSKGENKYVVACVNHDEFAIKSHHANHPRCIHYTEDIRNWTVVLKIRALCNRLREVFPKAYFGLHASLECTHFSKAKGGTSRDEDSRTLANHLPMYFCIDFDFITIENVEEFLSWGPLKQESKIVNGKTLYRFKWKKGAKKNSNIKLWNKTPYEDDKDFYDELGIEPHMIPIVERKKEFYNEWLKEVKSYGFKYDYKTLNSADFGAYTSRKRYFGKFAKPHLKIIFPKQTHIEKSKLHTRPDLKPHKAVKEKLDLEDDGNSLFGLNKKGKEYVEATFWRAYYGLLKFHKEGMFTIRYNGGDMKEKSKSVNKPFGTILTNNTHGLIRPVFLSSYYGNSKDGQGVHGLDVPCNTITTKDTFSLHHVQYAYGNACYSDIESPLNATTTVPKAELVTSKWLFDTQFDRIGTSVNKPCPTIIARQDKKPLYMGSANNFFQVPFKDYSYSLELPEIEVKTLLREFMRKHGIVDVKIRSLKLSELLVIQGFPEDYVLQGGKTRSMKYIGNSVVPDMSEALGNSVYESVMSNYKAA